MNYTLMSKRRSKINDIMLYLKKLENKLNPEYSEVVIRTAKIKEVENTKNKTKFLKRSIGSINF